MNRMTDKTTGRKPGTFVKGDKRINRKGRPKNFDALRRLALEVAHRELKDARGEPLIIDGQTVTVIEGILAAWSQSSEPMLQKAFVEIAYGKVPNVTELTGKDGSDIAINVVDYRTGLAAIAPDTGTDADSDG